MPVAIPAWNAEGVLPPINETRPAAADRSPYQVRLTDIVLRFGATPERRQVLDGLLRYRAALQQAGLVVGFQWINGSFMEQIELLEMRAPNDVDVVTFYHLPAGMTQAEVFNGSPDLFPSTDAAQSLLKAQYHVDAYNVHLATQSARLVERSTYWYSMWSHRRNKQWKGYLQVDLSPADDPVAVALLQSLMPQGGQP